MVRFLIEKGDCLEKLKQVPDDYIDLILTDPPYNISKDNNFTSMGRSGIDFGEWDHNADLTSWIEEGARVLKPGGGMVIFNAWLKLPNIENACEDSGLIVKDLLRWEKSNPMPRNRNRRYIVDYEFALWIVKKGRYLLRYEKY